MGSAGKWNPLKTMPIGMSNCKRIVTIFRFFERVVNAEESDVKSVLKNRTSFGKGGYG